MQRLRRKRCAEGFARRAVLAALAAGLAACGGGSARPPERDCSAYVWARARSPASHLEVVGDFSGWASPGAPLVPIAGAWRVAPLDLPPGEHGYLVVEDGEVRLDEGDPLSAYRGEQEVSLLTVDDCSVPALTVDRLDVDDAGTLSLEARFLAATGGAALDPATLRARTDDGVALSIDRADPVTGVLEASASGLSRGKHTVRFDASDASGRAAEATPASAWVRPAQRAWGDGVLYQIMIDRYRGDGGAPLAAPKTPGSRAGGTLDGVRAEIERGTFDALGVSALWLSPVYVNPKEARVGRDGHPSEGYHGYWPVESRAVDPRIGGEAALDAVVAAAHRRGIRVLADFVPNHVYETNPRYLAHQKDGWFDVGADACVCGAPGCDWGAHILTCWFAPYLPDVRWQSPDAASAGIGDATFWTDRFDLDGLRIDAVPMMPRSATRRIAHAVRAARAPLGDARFVVGEVFTGPGAAGFEAIRYFLGARDYEGLDSAFDFPLMWAVRGALASGTGGLDDVETELARDEAGLAGSGSFPSRMLDNHDTTRFVSEVHGDAGGDPWTSPPSQPADAATYARLEMALALLLTLPGVPVLYYGDEVGLAGGADPDSRRVMPDEAALSAMRAHVLATARRLGTLRASTRALGQGRRVPLVATSDALAFARDAGDGAPVVAAFSRAAGPLSIPPGAVAPGLYVDAVTGDKIGIDASGTSLPMAAWSFRVLVREGGGGP
jgi:glycosidase